MANYAPTKPFKDGHKKLGGVKKGYKSLTTILKEKLGEIDPKTGKSAGYAFVGQIMKSGHKTDGQSRKLVMQYSEGMPAQNVNVESNLSILFDASFVKPKQVREITPETPPEKLKTGHKSHLQPKDIASKPDEITNTSEGNSPKPS